MHVTFTCSSPPNFIWGYIAVGVQFSCAGVEQGSWPATYRPADDGHLREYIIGG